MLQVLREVYTSKGSKTRPAVADDDGANDGDGGIDEIRLEAMASYSARMGRWRREVLEVLQDKTFIALVQIMLAPHRIMNHMLCFLQKVFTSDVDMHLGQHVAQLTVFKAAEFAREFSQLIQNCDWILDIADLAEVEGETKDMLVQTGILMVLHHAASYDRRVKRIVTGYLIEHSNKLKASASFDLSE